MSVPLRFLEIVIKRCSRTFGTSPCTASTANEPFRKCYNSTRTCQDPANYLGDTEQVLIFAEPTSDLPLDVGAIPMISSISTRPQLLDPGESLGVRESVVVTMINGRDNDVLFDQYPGSLNRPANPYLVGTFWGKFFARFGNLQGSEARIVEGVVGQTYASMSRKYYIIDGYAPPDNNGRVSFTLKDVIKLIDEEKALAPEPSPGRLAGAITDTSTSFTLTPAGIGASDYPTSGNASIDNEIVTFTRSGDTVTLTARGQQFTKAEAHEADATFQLPLEFSAAKPSEILETLITNYTSVPATYVDEAVWEAESDAFIALLYTASIFKPEPVRNLIDELINDVGLLVFSDTVAKKIKMFAMRPFAPTLAVTDDIVIAGSINVKAQTEKRLSEVWTYYGKKNPLLEKSKRENYAGIVATLSTDPILALEETPRAVKTIFSRYILASSRAAAEAINFANLGRYEKEPRLIGFKLPLDSVIGEGQAITVQSRIFEDDQGNLEPPILCQVVSISKELAYYSVLAEETRFSSADLTTHYVYVDNDALDVNLRTLHDSVFVEAVSGDTVILVIAPGVKIGSTSTSTPGLTIGDWATGVTIIIQDSTGRAAGKGGLGGESFDLPGKPGGTALYTRYPITIEGSNLQIWGGGGGGGASNLGSEESPVVVGGGPGGGFQIGGPNATTEAGSSGFAADGGAPGVDGFDGLGFTSGADGGAAGAAIDGVSYVTFTGTPDIRGPQIN